jgi:hypothetical protein
MIKTWNTGARYKKNETLRDPWKEKYFGPIDKSTIKMCSPEEKAKMDAENQRFNEAMKRDMEMLDADPVIRAILGRK